MCSLWAERPTRRPPREQIEARIEEAVQGLRERPPSEDELKRAKRYLIRELIFDVETTEDAAHSSLSSRSWVSLEVLRAYKAQN